MGILFSSFLQGTRGFDSSCIRAQRLSIQTKKDLSETQDSVRHQSPIGREKPNK